MNPPDGASLKVLSGLQVKVNTFTILLCSFSAGSPQICDSLTARIIQSVELRRSCSALPPLLLGPES
jgi:hypothetical protein